MKKNLLGIECPVEKAEYVVVPISYEATTSCFAGTYYAPLKILEASQELEDYLPELELNTGEIRIHTLPIFYPPSLVPEVAIESISKKIKEVVNLKKIPVIIGGEHTLTIGVLKAFEEDIKVIVVDAHLDFYDEFKCEKICHATVGKRIAEKYRMTHIGARAYELIEGENLANYDVLFVPQRFFFDSNDRILDEVSRGNIYISVDLDILSPEQGISVGNPVPEGWSLNDLLQLLNFFALHSHVVGIDFCEYRPASKTGDMIVSKIIQKTIAFMEIGKFAKEDLY